MAKTRKIPREIRDKYIELINSLTKWEYEYYVLSKPSVSDTVYNAKYYELMKMEETYPGLIVPYSPTQRVGGVVSDEYDRVDHVKPMLSLDKVNNDIDGLFSAIRKMKRTNKDIIAEDKFDGLTLVVKYVDGMLVQAVSRGDGYVGEDLTHTARTIQNLPLRIDCDGELIVRGEVYMLKSDFVRINEELSTQGLPTYATTRNLASGSLRQQDPAVCAKRNLLFVAYEIVKADDKYMEIIDCCDSACLMLMHDYFHLPVADYQVLSGRKQIESYIKKRTRQYKTGKIPYDIDGLVFKVDSIRDREELGNGSKYPKWAIAYKFEDDVYETEIIDIELQVSRSRRINPVAIINPVVIDGTEVSRATLNNFDYMKELSIGIGDSITVRKANGVIPNVVDNLTCSNSYVLPKKCPECGAQTVKRGAYLYCSNKNCIGAKINIIRHFASRNAMDIRGLSTSRIYDLLENGIISNVWDLYHIKSKKREIISLDGWGEKSYMNLYASIDKSRNISMDRFLYALGIPSLGYISAQYLCDYIDWNVDELFALTESSLLNVHDFGAKTAHAVYAGLHSAFVQTAFKKLVFTKEIEFVSEEVDLVSASLDGKVFAITGTLSHNREYYVEFIESHGGAVTDGIRKNTNVLLCGRKAGSKLDVAKGKGIKIVDEKELYKMADV